MKLFRLKQKPDANCDASRCKEADPTDGLPGELWGREAVKLCQTHAERAIEYARTSPPQAATAVGELGSVPGETAALVQAALTEGEQVLAVVRGYKIDTHQELAQVGEWLREVKARRNELERQEKEITQPINLALRKVRELFKPAKKFWADAEVLLKSKIGAAKLLEEQKNQAALKAAADAHAAGDTEGVVAATAKVTTAGDLAGITTFTKWTYVIEDESQLPREFLMPNERLIKEHCSHSTDRQPTPIAGVKFIPDVQVSARAAQ